MLLNNCICSNCLHSFKFSLSFAHGHLIWSGIGLGLLSQRFSLRNSAYNSRHTSRSKRAYLAAGYALVVWDSAWILVLIEGRIKEHSFALHSFMIPHTALVYFRHWILFDSRFWQGVFDDPAKWSDIIELLSASWMSLIAALPLPGKHWMAFGRPFWSAG